jgi:two-component system, OmpR family, sensor histidine kinase KdpD
LIPRDPHRQFTSADLLVFETVTSLIDGALRRARQGREAETARVETANEKLRNVLLASLSHDLKTPLTVMNGAVGALLRMRKKLPREAVDELNGLWGHLARLQKFVANLLRMAAITSGQLSFNFQPYLIQEIAGAALQRIEAQKGNRQIRTVTSGQIPMVTIDGALIEQVLINLLENAIAHTPDDGVITLSFETDADRVRVRVSDNGPGLPTGGEDQIFEKFHTRGGAPSDRQSTDRPGQGTGLGLAICKGIVEAHGGMIYAKTNPPKDGHTGASFILPCLRLKSRHDHDPPDRKRRQGPDPRTAYEGGLEPVVHRPEPLSAHSHPAPARKAEGRPPQTEIHPDRARHRLQVPGLNQKAPA